MNNKKYPNLKPWKPGQSGNPAGRKPGSKNISTIVQELLDQEANTNLLAKSSIAELVQGTSTSYAEAVVWATIHKAISGNMQAIIWIAEQQERGTAQLEVLIQEPKIISHIKVRNQSAVD